MSEPITFNIKYKNDKIKAIELDQLSKYTLDQKEKVRFEDLATSFINGLSAGIIERSYQIFKYAEMPRIALNAHSIKLGAITFSVVLKN